MKKHNKLNWKFDESLVKSLIGKKIDCVFETYKQVYRDKDKKCIRERCAITLKAEGDYIEFRTNMCISDVIVDGETAIKFTYDSGFSTYNYNIAIVNLFEDWENRLSSFGYVFDKIEPKEFVGFYIEVNDYKKIYVISTEKKVPNCTFLDGEEYVIHRQLTSTYFFKPFEY